MSPRARRCAGAGTRSRRRPSRARDTTPRGFIVAPQPEAVEAGALALKDGGDAWRRVEITADECPRISRKFLDEERAAPGGATRPLRRDPPRTRSMGAAARRRPRGLRGAEAQAQFGGDDELGIATERHRDHEPLAHAAAEVMRTAAIDVPPRRCRPSEAIRRRARSPAFASARDGSASIP